MKGILTKARLSSGWAIKLDGAILLDRLGPEEILIAMKIYRNLQAMINKEPIFQTSARFDFGQVKPPRRPNMRGT